MWKLDLKLCKKLAVVMSQVDYYLSIYCVSVCVVGGVVLFLGSVLCCILFLP